MKRLTVCMVMAISCVAAVSAPAFATEMSSHHAMNMNAMNMRAMARAPHHMLAMAYKDNMTLFAKTLQQPAGRTEALDIVMAREAVIEIRRSFGLMKQHCEDQMMTMSDDMREQMSMMTQQMDTKIATIGTRLEELELEVSYNALDARKISDLAGTIIHECDHMSRMHMPARNNTRRH